mmetsp:Transcript_99078/g.227580  ORF Transcript_99078/g.227580 Transcript_99078/m.227580 type:complete len:90 (-) Transcript_99078:157-426(-)
MLRSGLPFFFVRSFAPRYLSRQARIPDQFSFGAVADGTALVSRCLLRRRTFLVAPDFLRAHLIVVAEQDPGQVPLQHGLAGARGGAERW